MTQNASPLPPLRVIAQPLPKAQLDAVRAAAEDIAANLIGAGTETIEAEADAWAELAGHLIQRADPETLASVLEFQKNGLLSNRYDFGMNEDGTQGQETGIEALNAIQDAMVALTQSQPASTTSGDDHATV